MQLIILNQTSNTLSYQNGSITISANGNYSATMATIFPLTRDPQLVADCNNQYVYISDSVNIYIGANAINYLNLIANSLGGQVVGYIGTSTPNFAIQVGGKDPSGNMITGQFDNNGNLNTRYNSKFSNITGNGTTTVKSGPGILYGIHVNNAGTNGTVTIYDNTSGSGTKIGTITLGSPTGGLFSLTGYPSPFLMDHRCCTFNNGLTVVTAGSSSNDITVLYG